MIGAKFILMLPAAVFFALGATLEVRFAKTRKIGSVLMGVFFDGLGVWWILKTLNVSAPVQKWTLIAALAFGALGLISDALNIGGDR